MTRRHMPAERASVTKKFCIHAGGEWGDVEGYITVGLFPDGAPGEVFLMVHKEGSLIRGLLGAVGTAVSIGLQSGVPLATFVDKFAWSRFEPAGLTDDAIVPMAKSVLDYVFRWMELRFKPRPEPPGEPQSDEEPAEDEDSEDEPADAEALSSLQDDDDTEG